MNFFFFFKEFLDPGQECREGGPAGWRRLPDTRFCGLLMRAAIMGLLIQMLSARVGVATERHLADLCREEYPIWARLILWFTALIGGLTYRR